MPQKPLSAKGIGNRYCKSELRALVFVNDTCFKPTLHDSKNLKFSFRFQGAYGCVLCSGQSFSANYCICPPYLYQSTDQSVFCVGACGSEMARYEKAEHALMHALYLYNVFYLHYGHGDSVCEFLNAVATSFRLGSSASKSQSYTIVSEEVKRCNVEFLEPTVAFAFS